jgi:hypothetical protein
LAVVALVALFVLASCAGATDPASNVTHVSAQLNAHGYSNDGPATWWWEYDTVKVELGTANDTEVCGSGAGPKEPDNRCGPATGGSQSNPIPVNVVVSGLQPDTTYYFRACGQDTNDPEPTCANIRSFTTPAAPVAVSAYDSLATIRADQELPSGGSASASISAAANEFESFQLAVQAGPSPLSDVRVDRGQTLTGPGGATIPTSNLTIYREHQYHVDQRSDAEGEVGFWPDALIPETDDFYAENRNAFPYDLAPNQKLAVWVDVLVPAGAPSGVYTGSVVVSGGGRTLAEVPVRLTVHAFSIPSTPTLRSAFGGDSRTLPGGEQPLYAAAALNNRVSIGNFWPSSCDWFRRDIRPLVEGTDPRVKLAGARLSALHGWHGESTGSWRALADGCEPIIGQKYFEYVCDEPAAQEDPDAAWEDCNSTAARVEATWPGVRKLVTADVADAPGWATDLSPLVNQMKGNEAAYQGWRTGGVGRRLWPYTSCASHSCGEYESPEDVGWPGYAIDAPASQARAMGWLAFTHGADGELYWNTVWATVEFDGDPSPGKRVEDTWTSRYMYAAGGNGDGTLFYPGVPSIIGGAREIPIESIRLKRIRDGREDYEYLHILAQRGRRAEAMTEANAIFGSMQDADASPSEVAATRSRLAAMITG